MSRSFLGLLGLVVAACAKPAVATNERDASASVASFDAAATFDDDAAGPHSAMPEPVRIEGIDMHGDLRVLVLKGPHERRFAMVYLHGRCVYPGYYVESFQNAAARYGDLIALQGTGSCGGDGFLHTWSLDIDALDRRIDAALRAADVPSSAPRVLIGYSQGADRAEALAAHSPAKYPAVVLIASSRPPSPVRLRGVRAAVLMAGTRDSQANMREGLDALRRARVPTTFVPLTGAWHGHMGEEPEIEMGRALAFVDEALFARQP